MPSVRIIGRGRAGGSLAGALESVGWHVEMLGRSDDVADAADSVDLCVVATPDGAIADVAAAVVPGDAVVVHMAGSLGLDVLHSHAHCGALHPLLSLADADRGATLLADRAWFGVASSSDRSGQMVQSIVDALGGRHFVVADEDRASYHAAAAIASNHTTALLGQVARVAETAGVPFEAFVPLIIGSVHNVAALGAKAALTGPVARGDEATLDRHRAALDQSELELYEALVAAARKLIS